MILGTITLCSHCGSIRDDEFVLKQDSSEEESESITAVWPTFCRKCRDYSYGFNCILFLDTRSDDKPLYGFMRVIRPTGLDAAMVILIPYTQDGNRLHLDDYEDLGRVELNDIAERLLDSVYSACKTGQKSDPQALFSAQLMIDIVTGKEKRCAQCS